MEGFVLELINLFKNNIEQNSLLKKGDKILLGVSGGPDSLTMLDLFNRIKDEYDLELAVYHLNHGFRCKASREALFVEDKCKKMGIEIYSEFFDVPEFMSKKGLSPEEAARKVRFKLMKEKLLAKNYNKIALGHNKNDLVETVFLHLFRGSGLQGLTGISPQSNISGIKVIHPLLSISRGKIEDYCKSRGLQPCRDLSNLETVYTRNKIRHRILPIIEKEINPEINEAVFRTARILRKDNDYLEEKALEQKKALIIEQTEKKYVLKLSLLKETHSVLLRRIFKDIIYSLQNNYGDLYYHHYIEIENLLTSGDTGKTINLNNGISVVKLYDKIIIYQGKLIEQPGAYWFSLKIPDEVKLPGGQILKSDLINHKEKEKLKFADENICYCDFHKLTLPLAVRNRRDGDRFRPLGMSGSKKIKDFLIDQKVPFFKRNLIPLVVDDTDRIVWIAGYRMNDLFKLTKKTEKILKISLM